MDNESKPEVTIFQCFPTKGKCPPTEHDFEADEDGQVKEAGRCTKCGMSFIAHIHMEIP